MEQPLMAEANSMPPELIDLEPPVQDDAPDCNEEPEPLCPENVLERLKIALKIEHDIRNVDSRHVSAAWLPTFRNFRLNQLHLACFLARDGPSSPWHCQIPWVKEGARAWTTYISLTQMESLLSSFLQRTEAPPAPALVCSGEDGVGYEDSPPSEEPEPVNRLTAKMAALKAVKEASLSVGSKGDVSRASRRKACENHALYRDGHRCVVTGIESPVVYNIWPSWPYASNGSRSLIGAVHCGKLAMTYDLRRRLHTTLSPWTYGGGNSTDTTWNMLSLHPAMPADWNDCRFALRWVGVDRWARADRPIYAQEQRGDGPDKYVVVYLEWNWMRSMSSLLKPYYHAAPDDGRPAWKRQLALTPDNIGSVAAALRSGLDYAAAPTPGTDAGYLEDCPLQSGTRVKMRVHAADVDKFRTMIEAQWVVVKMAALSGAAADPASLKRHVPNPSP